MVSLPRYRVTYSLCRDILNRNPNKNSHWMEMDHRSCTPSLPSRAGPVDSSQKRYGSFMRSGIQGYKRINKHDSRSWAPGGQMKAPPNSIEQIPHPRDMDSALLGQCASVAARERFTSPNFWKPMCERAKELVNTFEAQDIALLLNGMARLQIKDPELIDRIVPRILEKLVFFNSTYLSMTLAALGKQSPKGGYPPEFLEEVAKELQGRIYEFYSPTEISMLINAIVRLEIKNARLITQCAEHTAARMRMDNFHVRDLSVIAHAFSRASWPDEEIIGQKTRKDVLADLFARIFEELKSSLSEATPQELARLLTAFARAEVESFDKIFPYCLKAARYQVIFLTPKQLCNAAFAFGEVLEITPKECIPELHNLFKIFVKAGVHSLHLFAYDDIISFLTSYSRWHISFGEETFLSFIKRAKTLSLDATPVQARNLLLSVDILTHRNCKEIPVEVSNLTELLLHKSFQGVDSNSIIKVVGALDTLQISKDIWFPILQKTVASDFSLGSKALYERLKEYGVDEEEDIMLAMSE